jgi:hypothetical protein
VTEKYFSIFEAVSWIAFGKAYTQELYIEEKPAHEKTGWHGKESQREFWCRKWKITPEEYYDRFINTTIFEGDERLKQAAKELIDALADEKLKIQAEGRTDTRGDNPPKIIPHNYFRANIEFKFYDSSIHPYNKPLEVILKGSETPYWYGVEIDKNAVMNQWRFHVSSIPSQFVFIKELRTS